MKRSAKRPNPLVQADPLRRQQSHGLCRLFLGAFGEDDGEGFGVVGNVNWVAVHGGFECVAQPVAGAGVVENRSVSLQTGVPWV